MSPTTYKDSGVDLELYDQAMKKLPALMHRTYSPRVLRNDGGFAGLFQLDFDCALFARNYRQPVLVSGTDGVGTKLRVAQLASNHRSVGIDLVAMCVNDCLCCGAEPLFFLDYVSMGKDNPSMLEQIVSGISDGCVQADCSLLGGETAIMPDHYQSDDYDLAGFCVGVAEKSQLITGANISESDLIIGIASSGFHSNGFSLVRKVVFEKAGHSIHDYIDELQSTVAQALLTPTIIYAKLVRSILRHYKVKNVVHGIAHITGGGLLDNSQRILPPQVDLVFQRNAWECPKVFDWVQRLGQIDSDEMDRVFNMGIGLVLVVSPFYANTIMELARQQGLKAYQIGVVAPGTGKCRWS